MEEQARLMKEAIRRSSEYNNWLRKNMAIQLHRNAVRAVWMRKATDWHGAIQGFNDYIDSLRKEVVE